MSNTLLQATNISNKCRQVFIAKTKDYGTSWRVLRPTSLTDQLLIKVKRIRTVQMVGAQKIIDPIKQEYQAVVNYSIMALIQLELPDDYPFDISKEEAAKRKK